MTTLREQARAEAEKHWTEPRSFIQGGMVVGFEEGFLAGHEAARADARKWIALAIRNGIRYCLCSRADRMHDRANPACPHHGVGMRQRCRAACTRIEDVLREDDVDAPAGVRLVKHHAALTEVLAILHGEPSPGAG